MGVGRFQERRGSALQKNVPMHKGPAVESDKLVITTTAAEEDREEILGIGLWRCLTAVSQRS